MPELDPAQLQAGQHVQILTGRVPDVDNLEIMVHSTMIAGKVKETDAGRVVLQNVVMIKESHTQHGVPIVNKVPYFSRLFKNTGVGQVSTAIPGEVAIELSEILNAKELTDVEFEAVRKNGGGYERIGVDFDFNLADGLDATPQQ